MPTYQNRPFGFVVLSSKPFSNAAATNGGSKSPTLSTPIVRVVLLSHALHPHGLYSAVETGITFFSLPSFGKEQFSAALIPAYAYGMWSI